MKVGGGEGQGEKGHGKKAAAWSRPLDRSGIELNFNGSTRVQKGES